MLPAESRLKSSVDFRRVSREGVRVGRRTLVVHVVPRTCPPSRAGFVVSKAVGNAVTRNRVKRRLRHLVAEAFSGVDAPMDVVVRALPGAATSPALADDLRSALTACCAKVTP